MINTLVFLLGLSKSQSRFLVRTFRESEVIIGSFSQAQAVIYNGLLDSSLPTSLHAHAEAEELVAFPLEAHQRCQKSSKSPF